jgi:threonylcarbamoyladenosine tRNA methylthiotransferase CDKAL1
MKRQYTAQQFCHVVEYLRERVPGITIATDVICGFPTESEHDHNDTMAILERYQFPVLHISQFYPRLVLNWSF